MNANWGNFLTVFVQCEQQMIFMKIVVLKFLFYFFGISDRNFKKPEISAYRSIRIRKNSCCFST